MRKYNKKEILNFASGNKSFEQFYEAKFAQVYDSIDEFIYALDGDSIVLNYQTFLLNNNITNIMNIAQCGDYDPKLNYTSEVLKTFYSNYNHVDLVDLPQAIAEVSLSTVLAKQTEKKNAGYKLLQNLAQNGANFELARNISIKEMYRYEYMHDYKMALQLSRSSDLLTCFKTPYHEMVQLGSQITALNKNSVEQGLARNYLSDILNRNIAVLPQNQDAKLFLEAKKQNDQMLGFATERDVRLYDVLIGKIDAQTMSTGAMNNDALGVQMEHKI